MRTGYSKYVEDILGILEANMTDDVPSEKPAPVPKKLFSFIKHAKRDSSAISLLKDQGKELSEGVDKANALNRQFQSVFSPKSPLSLKQLCEMTAGANPQVTGQHCKFPLMSDIEVGVEGVSKLLKNLKTDKAAGPDQIRPVLLKELHSELSPVITLLFQLSLDKGCLPSDWVTANVTPLFKKGDRTKPSNYRPISLTCILCKTLEHKVTSKLVKHFTSNSILYDLQHGFREKRSCETKLIMLVNELASNIQHGKQTDHILLDFSKAFDSLSWEGSLQTVQLWYTRQDTGLDQGLSRKQIQMVVVDEINSSSIPVTFGVPQGSVLGPFLFLAYINDLPEQVSSQVRLFADDTVVYVTINKHEDSKALQSDLHSLESWEANWDMEFNPSKCQVIHISTSRNHIDTTYTLHGQVLETTSLARYLGVDIAIDLSWKPHITRITSSASQSLGFLRRNIRVKHPQLKAMTYKALVRPQLEYASCVWDPQQATYIDRIEMVQRRAARCVCFDYSPLSSVTSMLDKLGWRSLEQRRSDARLSMLYNIVHWKVAIPPDQLIRPTRLTRHSHSYSFRHIQATKIPSNVLSFPSPSYSGTDSLIAWYHCPVLTSGSEQDAPLKTIDKNV